MGIKEKKAKRKRDNQDQSPPGTILSGHPIERSY
jgi:hypothetical protein